MYLYMRKLLSKGYSEGGGLLLINVKELSFLYERIKITHVVFMANIFISGV